ncbi:MGMT family protein [Salinarimonas chemoclinalis]|uniref:MGMT family protein n=1 Tax=Salinarimonas chemoclinalis TaxID=3241599 RepID=UPI003555F636
MASPFYARIKTDVLAISRAIPEGRLATYADIGAHLDVMPRHVAYILATLGPSERETVPWHRVVAADGTLGPSKAGGRAAEQRERLADEGVVVDRGGAVAAFVGRVVAVSDLAHGVPKQTRPVNAPGGARR